MAPGAWADAAAEGPSPMRRAILDSPVQELFGTRMPDNQGSKPEHPPTALGAAVGAPAEAAGTPKTLWTLVVEPAAEGSLDHLEMLFRMYKPAVCSLIRQYRRTLPQDGIEELYQQFVMICLRREFLNNVARSKGRFRHFLWTCVRNFLRGENERIQCRPEGHLAGQVANGVGDEDSVEIPAEDGPEWMALDEPWALQIESTALREVERVLQRDGRAKPVREKIRARLMAKLPDQTLKDDSEALGLPAAHYNSLFYRTRDLYQGLVRRELAVQVDASDLEDEFEHFVRVLGRIRQRTDAASVAGG